MIVSDLCDLFLSHAHGYYRKPKSKRLTREYGLIKRSLEPLREVAGSMAVDDVTAVTVATARQWVLDNLPGNCRNTVNKKVSRMVRVFRWGSQPERSLVPALVYAQLVTIRPLAYGRCSARETQGLEDVSRDRINDLMATLFDTPKHPGNADKWSHGANSISRTRHWTRHRSTAHGWITKHKTKPANNRTQDLTNKMLLN